MQSDVAAKSSIGLMNKLKDYAQLTKPNLSLMVVFSSVIGYLLAPNATFDFYKLLLLFIGGFLVTGSANSINQIIEKESDRFMKRTANRPLSGRRMQSDEAWVFTVLTGVAGVALLSFEFNWVAGLVSAISLLIYGFAYTPLKKNNSIAVLVGAIPGALPPLIGWSAATGGLEFGAWYLFTVQFFWQFPHFWAIAWVGFEDYEKAGIRMLPSKAGKTRFTGLQCMLYSLVLIPLAIMARGIQMTGNVGMTVMILCGVLYFVASVAFYIKNDFKSAKRVMFASFLYLPVVLLALLMDKL